jgi:alkylation response protein AidB-like acyl-CoA dehydrogenase
MAQVIEEEARFAREVIAPLNTASDAPGCRFEAGRVTMPPGFDAAYRAFQDAGWPALACAVEDGGQGLPWLLEGVLYEMLSASCHGWTMAPGLLHGAYECIRHHASDALKAQYLGKIASGEWLATMCLTEPQAGSDLGRVRTQAVEDSEGSHRLRGTKIFISGGEHDLTDNIVHLVLAREPGAPEGPKGLSLFLAPKVHADGTRNDIVCERIEEKMGLHGSPTCVLRFDDAKAWRVGERGKGLQSMFVMMNAARLHVALQGIGLLDAAWQKAHAYAEDRQQMRAPGREGGADGADPIIRHPAIRRILDTERASIDGLRLLAYRTAVELDMARHHPERSRRLRAEQWCRLVTPVLKTMCTEQAFTGASRCLQVFGGHGYIKEWGIEQIVRDARVTMIYEGTNEVQAIDLMTRVVLADGGASLAAVGGDLLGELTDACGEKQRVARRFDELAGIVKALHASRLERPTLAYEAADDFLRAVGLAMLAWAWARMDEAGAASRGGLGDAAQAARLRFPAEFDMHIEVLRSLSRQHA